MTPRAVYDSCEKVRRTQYNTSFIIIIIFKIKTKMNERRNMRPLLSIEKEALVLHLIKCSTKDKDKEPEKVCISLVIASGRDQIPYYSRLFSKGKNFVILMDALTQ